MASQDLRGNGLASTYFVQDRHNKEEELARLTSQDQLLTTALGGVLPDQPTADHLRRMLDVGCGTGGWVLAAAQTYPEMCVVGIDINHQMVQYARQQAQMQGASKQVEFHVMDALRMLEFPTHSFDLVNLRLGMSFMRTWDWAKLITEFQRVTRRGGILRLMDQNVLHQSTSPALTQFGEVFLCTFYRAGHLFEEDTTGLTAHLAPLLRQYGCQNVQTNEYPLLFHGPTEAGKAYCANVAMVLKTTRPFQERWGCVPHNYDALYQQLLCEMEQEAFQATWNFVTVWGTNP